MASRYEITGTVQQTGAASVRYVANASVQVKDLQGNNLTIYAAETGSSTLTNPLTADVAGRVDGWVEAPDFDLTMSGSGVTTYTQKVRQSPAGIFNVKSYGAKGDGTTNDATAIQAADTAAVAAGGGDIRVPLGTFRSNSNLTLSAGNRLIGVGEGSIIKTDSDIRCKSNTEVAYLRFITITSLARNGSNIPTVAARSHVYFYDDPNDLENCKAHHLTGDGLQISFFRVTEGLECHSNYFKGGYYDGINLERCVGGRVHHNRVRYCNADGIAIYGGSGHVFEANKSTHNQKNGFFSFGALAAPSNSGATYLTFIDNEASNSVANDGFDINGTGNSVWTFHKFRGNRAHDNIGWGYNFTGSGNTYDDNSAIDNGLNGFNLTFDTNVAARAAHRGIRFKQNISYNNNTTNTANQSLIVFDQLQDSIVANNTAIQPSTGTSLQAGLRVIEATSCQIHDNIAFSLLAAQATTSMVSITNASGKYSQVYNNRDVSTDLAITDQGISPPANAWTTATYLGTWATLAGFDAAGYWKDPDGIVHLRGVVALGTVGDATPIFTLPAGYRPSARNDYAVPSNSLFGYVRIKGTGDVCVEVGSNVSVALSGIKFRAEA